MTYQIVVINPTGATLRISPNTGGGIIRQVKSGEVFDMERLIFTSAQQFNVDSTPEFLAAEKAGKVVGEIWVMVKGLQPHKGQQVLGYLALRFFNTKYGVLVGDEPIIPPGNVNDRIAELDFLIDYLIKRRVELNK